MGTTNAPRAAKPHTIQASIERLADRLRIITEIASHVAHSGTREDPIPIYWYKSLGLYRAFEFVINGERKTVFPEDHDIELEAPRNRTEHGADLRGGRIDVSIADRYRPENIMAQSRTKPLQRLGPGMGNISRTFDQARHYREILIFNGVALGSLQIDHIHEIGLGGEDNLGNLWPLSASANLAANATYTQQVLVRKPVGPPSLSRVQDLDHKFFTIAGIQKA